MSLSPQVLAALKLLDDNGIRVSAADIEGADEKVEVACVATPQNKPYTGIVRGTTVKAKRGDRLTLPKRVAEALIAHKSKYFSLAAKGSKDGLIR
ncbi:MAG TPA: hypothetical protein VMX74_14740 [Pirellulales bacterium]|nr:hypothetical protein [Pirellulales bacterium]